MNRILAFCLFIVASLLQTAIGQSAFTTLDVHQNPGSTMLWLTPKDGHTITESSFFEQPGLDEMLGNYDEMLLLKTREGANDISHRRYQQRHAGYDVEGAMFATHEMGGILRNANGQLAELPTIAEEPSVTDYEAVREVQSRFGMLAPVASEGEDYIVPKVDLIYAPTTWETAGAPLEYRLTYRIAMIINDPYVSVIAYLDAHTREIYRWEHGALECSAGTALTLYNGWQDINSRYYNFLETRFELRDDCRSDLIHTRIDNHTGNPTRFYAHTICDDVKDGDNIWQAPDDQAAVSLHWAAEMYHDYLSAKLGRNGLSGSGDTAKVVYHPNEMRILSSGEGGWPFGSPGSVTSDFNAHWELNINEAHFGHADGISPFVSLDLVSHELTHGLMNRELALMFRGGFEAKAINEAFADIFSVCSEWYVLPLHDPNHLPNFTFHEDVAGGATRSMDEPWIFNMPRTYQGAFWQAGLNPEPHTNSAVMSYWFYLLAFGSAGKPVEPSTNVCGIGMDKAAEIAYRMITDYGTVGTFYIDLPLKSMNAAEDAFGTGCFEGEQCVNAWAAVGVGSGSNFCNPVGTEAPYHDLANLMSVFPNPANENFVLQLSLSGKESSSNLSLWDQLGRKVFDLGMGSTLARGNHQLTVDCSRIPNGTYHLDFSSKNSHLYKKIVILH